MSKTVESRRSYSLFKGHDGRSTLCDMIARLESDLDDAKTENDKLRELARMMLRVAGVAEYATDSEWQVITDYLRELGVEVQE